jgi:peptidoglycan/LPS O-acetylase OafA/YrhL
LRKALTCIFAHIDQVFFYRFVGIDHPLALSAGVAARHAVLLFFLLSGYLVTKSIRNNISRNGFFDPIDYSISRIARIWPPFLAALFLIFIVVGSVRLLGLPGSSYDLGIPSDFYHARERISFNASEIWTSLTMRSGMENVDGPLWSLYIEFQIYAAVMGGAMVFAGATRMQRVVGITIAVAAAQIGIGWNDNFYFFVAVWLLGASAALYTNRPLTTIGAVAAAVSAVAIEVLFPGAAITDTAVSRIFQFLCCIVYVQLILNSRALEFRFPKALTATGGFSYSLYLFHYPLLLLVFSGTQFLVSTSVWRTSLVGAAAGCATLAVSYWSAKFLEDTPRFKALMTAGVALIFDRTLIRFAGGRTRVRR